MKFPEKLNNVFNAQQLTRTRIILALAVGVIADGLQLLLGPVGWAGADEVIDVIAMGLVIWILGFHLLLLPTFVVEFIPIADMLPTWTGCVAAVIVLRKRSQRSASANVSPVVDVDVTPSPKPPAQIGGGASDQGTLPR